MGSGRTRGAVIGPRPLPSRDGNVCATRFERHGPSRDGNACATRFQRHGPSPDEAGRGPGRVRPPRSGSASGSMGSGFRTARASWPTFPAVASPGGPRAGCCPSALVRPPRAGPSAPPDRSLRAMPREGPGALTSAGPCLSPGNPSPGRPGLPMRRSPLGGSRTPGLGADVLFRRFILGEGAGWRGGSAGPCSSSPRPVHRLVPAGPRRRPGRIPGISRADSPSIRPPRPSTPSSRPTEPERPGTGVRHRNPPPGRDRSSTCRLPQTRSALIHLHPWVEAGHPRSPPVIHPGSDLPTWDSP